MNIISIILLLWICYSTVYTVTSWLKSIRKAIKEKKEKSAELKTVAERTE